jgi:hypothetical protein
MAVGLSLGVALGAALDQDNISFTMHGTNLSSPPGSNAFFTGYNDGTTMGILENGSFDDNQMLQLVFHEIGHGWGGANTDWAGWQALSGWTTQAPSPGQQANYTQSPDADVNRWYLSSSNFARNYGRTNPAEDFATSFALYFMDEVGEDYAGNGAVNAVDIPTKIAFLDAFFASI